MQPIHHFLSGAAPLALVACLALGACASGTGDGAAGVTVEPSGTVAADGGGPDGTALLADASTDPATASAAGPIATIEGFGQDDEIDSGRVLPVRIDVLSLDRATADTVRLRFTITNVSNATVNLSSSLAGPSYAFDVSGVSLIDLAGNRRYLVLTDEDDVCVCTTLASSNEKIAADETRQFDATFPAPPAGVTLVDVQITSYGTLHDVPLGGTGA